MSVFENQCFHVKYQHLYVISGQSPIIRVMKDKINISMVINQHLYLYIVDYYIVMLIIQCLYIITILVSHK